MCDTSTPKETRGVLQLGLQNNPGQSDAMGGNLDCLRTLKTTEGVRSRGWQAAQGAGKGN